MVREILNKTSNKCKYWTGHHSLFVEQWNANDYLAQEGAGEKGKAVQLNITEEQKSKNTFQINQFNLVASDKVALNRSLPDIRKKACREKIYPSELPDTSVIIVYHNEAWSTLLRTVTSVIHRSPRHLLREVILVDDNSNRSILLHSTES